MVIEDKMSTMSSPIYPASPTEEKEGYEVNFEGGCIKREEEDNDSDDEYIDVDDSFVPKRYNGDVNEIDGKDSSGEESSVKSPDSTKKNSEKKLYRCQHCKYVTDRKNNLKRHVVTMHEQCQKTLECCDVIFQNKASLRDHVLSCHRNGYDCRICGRNFCRKALLKRHITVHSGQKDYICSVCGYATSHKSNLDRHKRRHGPKYPLDGSKYRIPDSIEINAVKALSPSSLSSGSSPPPLPKCHAFSIERLVGDDYHPRRAPYSDVTSPTMPVFTIKETSLEPKKTNCNLPPKKRHLNSRYLFTKRLICTHKKGTLDSFVAQRNILSQSDRQSIEQRNNNDFVLVHDKISGRRDMGRISSQSRGSLLLSSKRLVPELYQCKICDTTFENQMEMNDHFNQIKHDEWMPCPQRPLTIQARQKDIRYIY